MNAPTDIFYKYICLQPGFDINNPQSKALFGKESCQRQLTERLGIFDLV